MARKKNLERAIVLGLFLSTGVYGSAWAAEYPDGIEIRKDYTEPIINNGNNTIGSDNLADFAILWTRNNVDEVDIIASGDNFIKNSSVSTYDVIQINNDTNVKRLNITAGNNNEFSGAYKVIAINAGNSAYNDVYVTITSENGSNIVNSVSENGHAIYNSGGSIIFDAKKGYNILESANRGLEISAGGYTEFIGKRNSIFAKNAILSFAGNDENVISILSTESGNEISSSDVAIEVGKTKLDLIANNATNDIYSGNISNVNENKYGSKVAINATSGSRVSLQANGNNVYGAVYASGSTGTGENKVVTDITMDGNANQVYSNAYITNAGGLKDKNVISALYAQKGAHIDLNGDYNLIGTYADSNSSDLERVVWAYDTADIDITGLTAISTDSYDKQTNSKDIAIAAGTATGLENLSLNDILNYDTIVGKRASVKVNYESDSSITGDILSAYGGEVNITPNSTTTRAASDAKINIHGNLLAGNNGKLTVDLGKGGSLTGRADDYGDAGLNTGHGAVDSENSFFNPAFSSEIKANGTVNLTMGVGSRWDVTGQSWITSLTTTGNAEDTLISLEKAKEDLNSNASALTIGTLKGDTRFYMNLDGDRSASDMLYIKNAQGVNGETAQYDIYLQEEVTSGEINAGGFNGLRFATVGEGSKANFTVRSQGTGSAFDVEYEVDTDSYVGNSENSAYNSTTGGDANVEKPGNDSVNDFFDLSSGTQEDTTETIANNIMLMAENEEAAENVAMNNNTGLDEVTNFKIVARKGEEISDTGKTILNMSRANYSNAIYMDRLNKRLGEARYINSEEEDGMWVRIRHDRIGKTDAYRSQNTMYELGYDQKQECDNGERRVGMAIDYMHGDTGYDQIAGKGEIDRYGLWLYDTWMGDKGHYADYVAKWGHLSNDFEVYTMNDKTKQVTGDYSNNVFSVSAEYGRKKDIGNDWYFEPQVQAQLARVTGADYTTNQGTKVSVDGINSLIGRAGFRLGKDFGEEKQSTVYIKADVLHEFLGDQDVRVLDKSSDNKWAGISYENEGTWYDVGFGFATQMSKNSYAFMDFEKSFGNDNDETYQINVGMQWSF
mgnify:CR=1 FL=1